MMEWAYSGVNKTVPRNAGPECAEFMNPIWRRIETVFVLAFAVTLFKWSYSRISLPTVVYVRRDRRGRRTLLVMMSLIWGMEIGYKFSSRTVIYLLNPCHVTTAIQVIIKQSMKRNWRKYLSFPDIFVSGFPQQNYYGSISSTFKSFKWTIVGIFVSRNRH